MLNAGLAAEPEKSVSTTVNHGIGGSSPHAGSVMGKATSKKNGLKNLTKRTISTGKKVNSRCARGKVGGGRQAGWHEPLLTDSVTPRRASRLMPGEARQAPANPRPRKAKKKSGMMNLSARGKDARRGDSDRHRKGKRKVKADEAMSK